jgi:hypothetical protein
MGSFLLNGLKQFDDYANDSRFVSIIRDLPSFVESARSESTNKKYKCYFKKLEKWCISQRPDTTRQRPDTTRIRVKGMPLSADDGNIRRMLKVMIKVRDEEILHMHREQLRVDGRLTGCETGDSIIISKTINCDIISSPI